MGSHALSMQRLWNIHACVRFSCLGAYGGAYARTVRSTHLPDASAAPFEKQTRRIMMAADRQVAFLPPGEGKSYWIAGDRIDFKLTGHETGGAFELCEVITPPQVGPPPHIHQREDETFYVIEGEVEFMVGDRTLRATPGSVVHGVRGVPHAFRNVGEKTSRMVLVVTPANFASFVRAAGQPATDPVASPPPPGPAEIEKLLAAGQEHGIALVGPPPSG